VIGVNVKKIVALIVASCIGWVGIADAAEAPRQVDRVQMRQHPFDYVPEKKRTVPAWAKCPEIWNRLRDAGWLEKDVIKADQIVWRESRCIATAHNKKDPNTVQGVKGSLGLFPDQFVLDSAHDLLSERIFANSFESRVRADRFV
jgi:hypothetical protein